MKNFKIYTYILGLILLSSCQNEELVSQEGEMPLEITTSTQTETRTSLADNGKSVLWNEGDAIAVYDFATSKRKFVAEINDNNTHFKGKITPKYGSFIAAYPYDLAAENDVNKKILLYLPEEQTAVEDGFASGLNLSIAKGERNVDGSPSQVQFRNVCQLFKLTIPEYISNRVAKIELTANTAIAGELTVDYSDYNPEITISNQGAKTIALLPPSGSTSFAEGSYYIVLAPSAINGFTITLEDVTGKTYVQHSNTSIGGNWGVICNLGNMDMVDKPVITPKHVYEDQILVGTQLSLTAPVADKAWTAVVKNSNGETVRTLSEGTGVLTSDHTDATWPYLPKGTYTVEYTFTTANGKIMSENTSFQITEDPQFSLSMTAYSTYSYYQSGNIEKANGMNANTVDGISSTVNGISPTILANEKYTTTRTNSFNGTETAHTAGTTTFSDISIAQLGLTELSTSFTFDGVAKHASISVHITGLPFRHEPPKTDVWSRSGDVTDEGDHTLFGRWSGGSQKLTYNGVNIPSGTKMSLGYKFRCYSEPVATDFTISAGNQSIVSGRASGSGGKELYEGNQTFTNSGNTTQIICNNSYGAGLTYTQLYLVALSYSK